MKTCSLSEAKRSLGKLADEALAGRPTVISRGGKLLILQAYDPPDPEEFDGLIDEGIRSDHIAVSDSIWDDIRNRGKELVERSLKRK